MYSERKKSKQGLKDCDQFLHRFMPWSKEVSGDLNDVRVQSVRIHSFEPSANDIAAIYDADVFVYHSHTLESWAGSLDQVQKSKR